MTDRSHCCYRIVWKRESHRDGDCSAFGEWVTIHARILADSSASAQKASREDACLSEKASPGLECDTFGAYTAGGVLFIFTGFLSEILIWFHLFFSAHQCLNFCFFGHDPQGALFCRNNGGCRIGKAQHLRQLLPGIIPQTPFEHMV